MIVSCYDRMVAIIKNMLSNDEKLVRSFYASKKMMKRLRIGYEKIDVYRNDCMLFYKEDEQNGSYDIYGKSRFKLK